MESTGSFTPATAPAAGTSLKSLAIRDEDNKLARKRPSSSRAPSSASNKKAREIILGFKCKYCPTRFTTARWRGGHQGSHRDLPEFQHHKNQKQKQKERRRRARAQSSSAAAAGGGGHVVGISRQLNQEKTAQYYSWLLSVAVPIFVSQTQTGGGTSGLLQLSLATPAPVAAEGNGGGGSETGVLGGQKGMPEVDQEETPEGIDLTLRL